MEKQAYAAAHLSTQQSSNIRDNLDIERLEEGLRES